MAEHPYRRADAGASPIHRGQWTRRALLRVTGASAAMLLTNRLTPSADLMPLADADQPQDLRQDPHYLESKIRSINDEELFAALDLNRPDLAAVGTAVARADYQAAYAAWAAYWPQLVRRGHWRGQEFVYTTPDEAAASLRGAQAGIVNAAEQVLKHNINGWGTVTIQHGPVVDFNADYGVSGKYGFHYWGWAHPLVEAFLLTQDP
ncbi:MAG: hypothetical protein JOZ57_13445, partial [Abitibacteriaceae bacterium]|nr:hypothetical protein [Abditibacteriaceae bacterium]